MNVVNLMQFFIFVLLICFFIFLFPAFLLSRDDFVFIRKDVTTEKVFNIAFVMFAASIFCARILYAVLNPGLNFLNPLVFFLFPYFPGLSLVGGVGGGVLFLLALSKFKKLPFGRLFDFFSISFLSSFPFGILGYFLLSEEFIFSPRPIILFLTHVIVLIFFLKLLLPRMLRGRFKDGTVGFLFLISFSAVFLVDNAIGRGKNIFNLGIEDLILVIILYTSVVFIFRQEKVLSRIKKVNLKRIARARSKT